MADKRFGRKINLGQCSIVGCANKAKARDLCETHYKRWRLTGTTEKAPRVPSPWKECSIDGCASHARTRFGRYCEVHYYRFYRNGTYDKVLKRNRTISEHGYVRHPDPTHPVASGNGHLYEHRMVCYDATGPGSHPCHWCGRTVTWGAKGAEKLVVDHLDNNKLNNSTDNLKPACNRCNARRGLLMAWVRDHKDDPWLRRMLEDPAMTLTSSASIVVARPGNA
jgi:hypothetical protein